MDTQNNNQQFDYDDGDPRTSPDVENLASDKDTTGNRRDESQIIGDQDLTNDHDISGIDEKMGAITNSMDSLEDEPEEFLQGDVDVVTQMRRTTRAMEDAIDESSGRKAHVKHDTYKNQ